MQLLEDLQAQETIQSMKTRKQHTKPRVIRPIVHFEKDHQTFADNAHVKQRRDPMPQSDDFIKEANALMVDARWRMLEGDEGAVARAAGQVLLTLPNEPDPDHCEIV